MPGMAYVRQGLAQQDWRPSGMAFLEGLSQIMWEAGRNRAEAEATWQPYP